MLRKICVVHLFSTKALDDFRHIRQEEVSILAYALVQGRRPITQCVHHQCVVLDRRVLGDGTGGRDAKSEEFKTMVMELMVLASELS
ncbi:flavonoid 3 -hydroxylase, partial [Olea europaea subsp. europaea]